MVETLAGLPGRKAILYVSDGLSMRPGEDIFYALDERFRNTGQGSSLMEIHRYDMTRDYQRLTAKANANRVTFYTLDAAGLAKGDVIGTFCWNRIEVADAFGAAMKGCRGSRALTAIARHRRRCPNRPRRFGRRDGRRCAPARPGCRRRCRIRSVPPPGRPVRCRSRRAAAHSRPACAAGSTRRCPGP